VSTTTDSEDDITLTGAQTKLMACLASHNAITAALNDAMAHWQVEIEKRPPEKRMGVLPKSHSVHAIVRESFGDLIRDLAPKGRLNYPKLLSIQVESSKRLFASMGTLVKTFKPRVDIAFSDIGDWIGMDMSDEDFYDGANAAQNPFIPRSEKKQWTAGFREGFTVGRKFAAKNAQGQSVPDQRYQRSEQFWLTYQAWLSLETNPSERRRLSNLSNSNRLIAVLVQLGVREVIVKHAPKDKEYLIFRSSKTPDGKKILVRTFLDHLSDWTKEFRFLAKPRI